MKYYMVFVCIALASFNFKANCFPSRQSDNPCHDQPNGSFLDHPLGCKYFIVCNNGEVNMGVCPDGLAFNPLRPPCDLESNVDCSQFSTQSPTTQSPTTTTQSTTTTRTTTQSTTTQSPTTTTQSTTTQSPTTTASSTTTVPTTTSTTTQSTTPQATTVTTTSTTTSQPTTIILPTTTITPTSTTTVRPVTPEMPEIPENPEQVTCPDDDPDKIVFIASNTHCSKYYICYHNKPIEMTCSPNLHWNINTQKCDSIEETKCTVSPMPSFFPVCPRDEVRIYPHPLNCEWFLYCNFGHMTVQQCPFFYHFDSETQSCKLKTVAKCVLYRA